jgi:hypothetical protein
MDNKIKFKGKFQEACCVQRSTRYPRLMEEYDAGWEYYRHCPCHVCELRREENGVTRCVDKSCEGCKNLKEGKKIRNWMEDICKGASEVEKE